MVRLAAAQKQHLLQLWASGEQERTLCWWSHCLPAAAQRSHCPEMLTVPRDPPSLLWALAGKMWWRWTGILQDWGQQSWDRRNGKGWEVTLHHNQKTQREMQWRTVVAVTLAGFVMCCSSPWVSCALGTGQSWSCLQQDTCAGQGGCTGPCWIPAAMNSCCPVHAKECPESSKCPCSPGSLWLSGRAQRAET